MSLAEAATGSRRCSGLAEMPPVSLMGFIASRPAKQKKVIREKLLINCRKIEAEEMEFELWLMIEFGCRGD